MKADPRNQGKSGNKKQPQNIGAGSKKKTTDIQGGAILDRTLFLPVSGRDLETRGWDACDFIFVSGDAYVDHPAFAAALIGRVLESQGYRVGILAQPDLSNPESLTILGRPRLGFLVGAGAMDSMVNHYTAAKKPRSDDAYTPGGTAGKRPDRAVMAYVNAIRAAWKDVPVIIGGIEASLRRLSHYDYWSDTVRRSVLLDSKADLLVYGMGEAQILDLANQLRCLSTGNGHHSHAPLELRPADLKGLKPIRGTVRATGKKPEPEDLSEGIVLPSHSEQVASKADFARAYALAVKQTDPLSAKRLFLPDQPAQGSGANRWVIQEPPALPLDQVMLDSIYELAYTREAHPDYASLGGVPALEEVKFSLVSSRGCFGSCSFCALTYHQGRIVKGRSAPSILREAKLLTKLSGFKGYIHDIGGPTANFKGPACAKQEAGGACTDKPCLAPTPCPTLRVDHSEYLQVLRELRSLPGIKKVFIRSGIRFDYLIMDPRDDFFRELCEHHVSGRLKVAPEHVSDRVLKLMGKPAHHVYERFTAKFAAINNELGLAQQVVPYFISSHPGSTLADAVELALYLKRSHFVPDSVQDFYPTPGTRSTCMFHTGLDPETMKEVFVAKGEREKALQRALLQYNRPENEKLVRAALNQAGRTDLIGKGPDCLLRY